MDGQRQHGAARRRALAVVLAGGLLGGLPALASAQTAPPATTGASAWGANSYGQLGDGTVTARRTTVPVKDVGATAGLAAGDVHSLLLAADGVVRASGYNGFGQLGDGTTSHRRLPVAVTGLGPATAVAAGGHFSLAVRSDGTVASWGRNSAGQLGDGTVTTRRTPVTVSGLRSVRSVAAGDLHALAVTADGAVWAWGANSSGQLGDATTTARRTPVRVAGLTDVLAVAAGTAHSLALRADGTVWAWGSNGYGQLGDGTGLLRKAPVQVVGLAGATSVAAGDHFSLALLGDGAVRSWGRNTSGQLGDGTATTRRTPVSVSGLTSAVRLAAGDTHGLAVLESGAVRAWGLNAAGQLGDGTTTARRTPVPTKGLLGAGAVAAGTSHSLTAGPRPLTGPQPDGWWSGDVDGSDSAGVNPVALSGGVGTLRGQVACGFAVPAQGRLTAPDVAELEPGTSFAFSAWLSPEHVSGVRTVATKADAARSAWSLAVVDGRLRFTASADGTAQRTVTTADPVVVPDRWQHVAVVYDGALTETLRVQVLVDGAAAPLAPFPALSGPPASIANLTAPTRFGGADWTGGLDELKVFGTPLTAPQVGETLAADLERADDPCDTTAPVTHATPSTPANAAGWHRGPVDVLLEAEDGEAGTGVESLTWTSVHDQDVLEETVDGGSAVVPVTGEGLTTVTSSAVDLAGNTEVPQELVVRVDSAAPSLTASRPAVGPTGWSTTPVTVSWSCTDALSGVAQCPEPTTVATDGADQSVTGTASDAAGGTSTVTLGDIDVDQTAPVLTGAPDAGPEWVRRDVSVHWTAVDAVSGVEAAPSPSVLRGEGAGLTATATVTDRAGNLARAVSPPVSIDRTAPVTTAVVPGGWARDRAVVELQPHDGLSGVAATWWSLDGAEHRSGTSVAVEGDGEHVLRWFSVDVAGNVEPAGQATVLVDGTAPSIRASLSEEPNDAGWHAGPVTVSFTCSDASSGVASCSGPSTVEDEGSPQRVEGEAVDHAGHVSTTAATVHLDRTRPDVVAAAATTPDSDGWYAAPVTVGFTCTDALSGVATCPTAVRLGEGRDQQAHGTATDVAGNEGETTLSGLDVDLTPPSLHGTVPDEARAGWSRGSVTVRWTCADALSGIAGGCPEDTVLTGEGSVAATATVRDRAGHATTAVVDGVRLDSTPPVTVASTPAPAGAGWHPSTVAVTLSASDLLSGPAGTAWSLDAGPWTAYDGPVQVNGDGTHELRYRSTDVAGNVEPEQLLVLRLDGTAPVVTAERSAEPGPGGWNTAPVVVRFTCADAQSGVASCSAPVTVDADGAGQQVTGTAVDAAGNTSSVTLEVSLDTVAPAVDVLGPDEGAQLVLGTAAPVVGCTAADSGSGLSAPCSVTTTPPSGQVGSWTATATAVDVAGNTATATRTWSVVYGWGGWAPPLRSPGRADASGTVTAKAGSTLPVSFALTDAAGAPVRPASAPVWLEPQPVGTPQSALHGSGTPLRVTADGARHEWKTDRAQAGTTWLLRVRLDDGTVRTLPVVLR